MKKLFLLDMDGTLYLGDQLFEGTAEFLTWVRASGGQYAFLTNNSSRGIEGYLAKMERLGIPQKAFSFLTSTDATIDYLKKTYPPFAPGRETDPAGEDAGAGNAPETAYYVRATLVCGAESASAVSGFVTDITRPNPEFTASIMTAYARAVFRMYQRGARGCISVFDVAPADLSLMSPEEMRKNLL